MPLRSCKVAVIGAGPSGLFAARELLREGHVVTVFEKAPRVGGTWVYDPRADSDPSGRDPAREVVHTSLYRSLRTNLPRPLMSLADYPFAAIADPRPFPAHEEVLAFLEAFARDSGVDRLVRLGAEVVRVKPGRVPAEWFVESKRDGAESVVEVFDAVVVCNGHCTEPKLAEIPGIEKWPGKEIHSHNYRAPEPFQDQTVVVIGRGPSAYDIHIEISRVAKEVHLSSRSQDVEVGKIDGRENIWQHLMIKYVHEDGMVEFEDGSSVLADVILHCTGYKYHFPFLDTNEIVSVDNNRVGPLYKHVFPPHQAPWLSFIGLPNQSTIFLVIELQSKWVAQVLSGKVDLPSEEDMMASVNKHYLQMEEIGKPKEHTHSLHLDQVEYRSWIAAEVGLPPEEEWKEQMLYAALKPFWSYDDGYRDKWDADYWNQQSKLVPQ